MSALFTFVGVITSLYMSVRALQEVQADRKLRQLPHLVFEPGGHRFPIVFAKPGRRIPGKNPKYVEKVLHDLPEDAEMIRVKDFPKRKGGPWYFGRLYNYGLGPALDTCITWIPLKIWFGSESFLLDKAKLAEPRYDSMLNSIPAIPAAHIFPSGEAGINGLPAFIYIDVEKKITEVRGMLEIECKDVYGQVHITRQEFLLFTGYKEPEPYIHVTFGDVVKNSSDLL